MHRGGTEQKKNQYIALADLRGAGMLPPGPNSFIFMQFTAKMGKITPTWELAPSPQEKSGSATALIYIEKTLW